MLSVVESCCSTRNCVVSNVLRNLASSFAKTTNKKVGVQNYAYTQLQ